MKTFIQDNVSLTLFTFFILGLLIPGVEHIPGATLPAILGVVIFLACYKINFQDLKHIHVPNFFIFYLLRFILFPAALYYVTRLVLPAFAPALFLLALIPPGTSSPAMSSIFKGNVALAFGLLVIGNLLAPLTLPLMISLVIGKTVAIDIKSLLFTLILSILVPIICFIILRKQTQLKNWAKDKGSAVSIVLIGITLTIATAKRKDTFLHAPSMLSKPLIVAIAGVFLLYVIGWALMKKSSHQDKISYALASGANNLSLGIGIALLYFPPDVCLFLILVEIPWIIAFIPFKRWTSNTYKLGETKTI